MCQLRFSSTNPYFDDSRHASHSCSNTATFYLYMLFIWLISFQAFIWYHQCFNRFCDCWKKRIWSGQETHISPILFPSKAFWLRAIEVFLAARVTLCTYGYMRLEKREEDLKVLRFCLLEQNKPDSWFAETAVVFSFIYLTVNRWTSCNTHATPPHATPSHFKLILQCNLRCLFMLLWCMSICHSAIFGWDNKVLLNLESWIPMGLSVFKTDRFIVSLCWLYSLCLSIQWLNCDVCVCFTCLLRI